MAIAPDNLDDILDHLAQGLTRLDDHADEYLRRRGYFEGTIAEIITHPSLARLLKASAQVHKLNFAAIPVNSLFDKVELASCSSSDAKAAKILADTWDENDLEDEADDWHRKAGYFGDFYAIVDVDEVDSAGRATKTTVIGSSPLSTVVIYSSKDGRAGLFAVKRWREGTRWMANVYYDDEVASLTTARGQDGKKYQQYQPDLADEADTESYRQANAVDSRLPVFHFRVDGKPYGQPVHRNAFGPQDSITKINATHLSAMDYQGYPQRYALVDGAASVSDDDIDEDFGTDGPDMGSQAAGGIGPDNHDKPVSDTSKLKSTPGSAWILNGIKSVGEFSAASEAPFINAMTFQVRSMATTTGTPLFEFDLEGAQPSGEARRRASGGINKHARKVKRTLGATWANISDYVLAVAGVTAEVSVNWLPTETETDKEGLELVAAKIKTGVPVRVALLEAGYTDEQVAGWYPDNTPALTLESLAILAEALAKLGQAVTLGTISSAELADMLPEILTAPRSEAPPVVVEPVAAAGVPVVGPETPDPATIKAQADALGALVRAGADPADAAAFLGFTNVDFPNLPTTVRVPDSAAAGLEAK